MTADFPVRPITADEFPGFFAVIEQAFHSTDPSEPALQRELVVFEPDRSLAAFDGATIVASGGAFTFRMSVPGAIADVAGVSLVSVLPGYRRRGLLAGLMRRQLDDVRDRGEAVAALFASEPGIYGRFGYGAASGMVTYRILRGEAGLTAQAAGLRTAALAAGLRLRVTDEPDPASLAPVYDALAPSRPGMCARDKRWWESLLADPEENRGGSTIRRCVVAEDATGPRGYGLYSVKPGWGEDGIPASVLRVHELMATDPAAYTAIWSDLLTRDLVGEVIARMRPVDDPLPLLLTERRRLRTMLGDGLWIRLTDVPSALAQRRYAGEVDLVIEVADELIAANTGRFRLAAAGPGAPASCERTTADADVTLPVASLGAAYLGGVRLGELAAAGLAAEHRPGAIAELSAAMFWDPAPWCPNIF